MRKINEAGLNLIKQFEGCKLLSYKDVVGIWTVGYGHTGPDVHGGLIWTQDYADRKLAEDLEKFEQGVENLVVSDINDNQFSALVCFAYNVGLHNLQNSTLLKLINDDNLQDAPDQFLRWNKAGGQVVAGLTRRREAERELFMKEES